MKPDTVNTDRKRGEEPMTLEKEVVEVIAGLGEFKEVRQRGD